MAPGHGASGLTCRSLVWLSPIKGSGGVSADPAVLLLDESTSSLDGRNEQVTKEAIESVAHDRTLVIVAHRLSTVIDADQIVVLDGGRVVGIGTHSALLASTPLYRELAEHQLLA